MFGRPRLPDVEAVADSPNRLEVLRFLRVVLDLGPQPLDGHVDEARVAEVLVVPYALEEELAREDLTRALGELKARLIRERGQFAPLGALYISCVARAGGAEREMQLVRDTLGDVPLAGFYANGEISNRRLYGYTGVLILFL